MTRRRRRKTDPALVVGGAEPTGPTRSHLSAPAGLIRVPARRGLGTLVRCLTLRHSESHSRGWWPSRSSPSRRRRATARSVGTDPAASSRAPAERLRPPTRSRPASRGASAAPSSTDGARPARRRDHPASRFLAEDEYRRSTTTTRAEGVGALIDSLEAIADDVAARVLAPASRAGSCPARRPGPATPRASARSSRRVGRRAVPPAARRATRSRRTWRCSRSRPRTTPAVPHDFYTAVELVLREHAAGSGVPVPHRGRHADDADPASSRSNGYEIAARLSYLLVGQRARRRAARPTRQPDGLADPTQRRAEADAPARRSARARSAPPLPRDVARLPRDPASRRAARRVQHRDHAR